MSKNKDEKRMFSARACAVGTARSIRIVLAILERFTSCAWGRRQGGRELGPF